MDIEMADQAHRHWLWAQLSAAAERLDATFDDEPQPNPPRWAEQLQ